MGAGLVSDFPTPIFESLGAGVIATDYGKGVMIDSAIGKIGLCQTPSPCK